MLKSKAITYLSVSFLWLINPVVNIGCDQNSENSFGEEEMLDLMDDINEQVWTFEDGERSYQISFQLTQQSAEEMASVLDFMGTAHACGSRSFVASASACIETTSLPMEGTVRISDGVTDEVIIDEQSIQGEMMVMGHELNNAEVYLNAENSEFVLSLAQDAFVLTAAQWE